MKEALMLPFGTAVSKWKSDAVAGVVDRWEDYRVVRKDNFAPHIATANSILTTNCLIKVISHIFSS